MERNRTGWIKFAESAGNHLLAFDPVFLERLKPFYKKTFRIQLTEPALDIDLRPCPDGFIIEPVSGSEPEVTLRGSLWSFMRLAREGAHSKVFAERRITMQGDAELGQAFQRTLADLQIDWEEVVANLLGDSAARELGRALDSLGAWINQSTRYFQEDSGLFLQEELKVTPGRVETDALTQQIEALRADTARLEARVARLRANITDNEDTSDA